MCVPNLVSFWACLGGQIEVRPGPLSLWEWEVLAFGSVPNKRSFINTPIKRDTIKKHNTMLSAYYMLLTLYLLPDFIILYTLVTHSLIHTLVAWPLGAFCTHLVHKNWSFYATEPHLKTLQFTKISVDSHTQLWHIWMCKDMKSTESTTPQYW